MRISSGLLRGAGRAEGFLFGSIPYAAAPVAERRYRAPQPPPRWDGARDASALSCPLTQPVRRLPGLFSEPLLGRGGGEHPELALNVWTPDPGTRGLPVLVWLHGGAFIAGSPGLYDGSAWMRDGVVLVTVGYRLGIEGFVHFEGGETNVALRDQLAALEWVQEEIEAFGGDPAQVCLAGQSAGAMSLGWLLGSQRSRGLFTRAISMSGGVEMTYSPEQAARVAAAVAERAARAPTAQAMRQVPLGRIAGLQETIAPGEIELDTAEHRDPTGGMLWVAPVRDGDVVAEDPLAAIGSAAQVDLLAGDTAEEGLLYLAGVPGFDEFSEESLGAFAARLSPQPQELLAQLRASEPDASAGKLAAQAITEVAFHAPTRALRERHAELAGGRTYGYRFTWRSGALGGRLGAAHAVDLPFVFDMLGAPGFGGAEEFLLGTGGGPQDLADRMHGAWVRFVRDGEPGWPEHPAVEVF
ncbi:MAG: carboxylesterase/lipase family protein [Solirubrobacteraceae bacterium]